MDDEKELSSSPSISYRSSLEKVYSFHINITIEICFIDRQCVRQTKINFLIANMRHVQSIFLQTFISKLESN